MKRVLLLALVAGLLGVTAACEEPKSTAADPKDTKADAKDNPVVVIDTSMGKIKVELFADKAPVTVKNFLAYVEDKFYDDTIFHRVMGKENTSDKKDFMIQGGGFTKGDHKEKKAKDPIKNEAGKGLSNKRGTIAMARTNDPDSATAQFFINVKDNDFLDKSEESAGYAVFGKVLDDDSMKVVDKIKAVKTGKLKFTVNTPDGAAETSFPNAPEEDVVIKSVRVEKPK